MPTDAPDPHRERIVLMVETGPNQHIKLVVKGPWDEQTATKVIERLELLIEWLSENKDGPKAASRPATT
jgi:hypothetical protein